MKEESRREAILREALALFSERGYDAVGVNELATAAGVTKPTLYYYFGSKEGLFDALLQKEYSRLLDTLGEACQYHPHNEDYYKDIYPVLHKVCGAYFQFAKSHTDFMLMTLSLSFGPPSSEAVKASEKYQRQQYALLEDMFRQMGRVHTNCQGRERPLASRFAAVVHAQIAFWRRGYATLQEQDIESIVRGFMHGIFA